MIVRSPRIRFGTILNTVVPRIRNTTERLIYSELFGEAPPQEGSVGFKDSFACFPPYGPWQVTVNGRSLTSVLSSSAELDTVCERTRERSQHVSSHCNVVGPLRPWSDYMYLNPEQRELCHELVPERLSRLLNTYLISR